MRIAIVGTELCAVDAHGGGLEQVLRRWASALSQDHEVVVISHQPHHPPPVPEPYETVAIDSTSDLAPTLARVGADVVSLHNRPQWADLCDPRARVGVTFHNYPSAWKTRSRATPRAALSAVSSALAEASAKEFGHAAVTVVPPSIDPVYCGPMARHPQRSVVSPNRLLRKKGVLELLDVARRPDFAGVRFEFADLISPWLRPTAEHRELRRAIAGVANASLFAPTSSLVDRYAEAGVIACVAQEPEGLGLVPLEAQACGAPVVTTDTGGLAEATMPPNVCVPPGDPDALAAELLRALRRTEPSEAARARVLERYAPATSAAGFGRWLVVSG